MCTHFLRAITRNHFNFDYLCLLCESGHVWGPKDMDFDIQNAERDLGARMKFEFSVCRHHFKIWSLRWRQIQCVHCHCYCSNQCSGSLSIFPFRSPSRTPSSEFTVSHELHLSLWIRSKIRNDAEFHIPHEMSFSSSHGPKENRYYRIRVCWLAIFLS